jgi:hypothetical protein
LVDWQGNAWLLVQAEDGADYVSNGAAIVGVPHGRR